KAGQEHRRAGGSARRSGSRARRGLARAGTARPAGARRCRRRGHLDMGGNPLESRRAGGSPASARPFGCRGKSAMVGRIRPQRRCMADTRVIKKYPNRRLYDTEESRYIRLADVRNLVLEDVAFVVIDKKTGNDITRSIL